MKTKFLPIVVTILTLFFFPKINVAQLPELGSAANFVLFTSNGAVTNTGVSHINGNIGTNSGLITGLSTSTVTGNINIADAVTAQCSIDLLAAYNQLHSTTSTSTHAAVLGNNETLNAGVYSIAAAGSLNSVLTLDAQGDSNAVFIFKIGAAFTTAASSTVSLVHGASANNVFWIAEGAIAMAASTTMKGTLISHNAAISIGAGSNLTGRMFSTDGAVTLDALSASIFPLPEVVFEQAPDLGSLASFVFFTTAGAMDNTGVSTITGNVGNNQGSITGFGVGNLKGSIHNADAVTAKCSTDLMNAYNQLISTATTSIHLPVLGNGETLYPGVYSLAAAGSIASVLTLDAQGDPNAVFIFKIGGAFTTAASSTVNLIDGASACNVFWVAEGAISMAASTTMKGTLISHNGSVSMDAGGVLEGRMFSTTGAASVYSVSASLPSGCSVATSWTGAEGTADWYTPGNWTRFVPDVFGKALIPTTLLAGRVFPILDSGIAAVETITIQNAATVTITNSTLQINGAIINNGTLNAANGTIEMIGFSGQTLSANTFQNNALNNLIISNHSAAGVILGGALEIYGSLTYTGTGKLFTTNDNLTLKSNATNTAWVGDLTGNSITGKVTVERYNSQHKAWRFLSIPTNTNQTIKESWQESGTGNTDNPVPGFGAQLTGPGGLAAGFDLYTATPSIKTYNPITNGWEAIPNTNTTNIKSTQGYMVLIRGNRTSNAYNSPVTETVLRTKGLLYTGSIGPISVLPEKMASIGNPYASPIDFTKVTRTNGVDEKFYVWDPFIPGYYNLGGYQTMSATNNWEPVPGGSATYPTGIPCTTIQSGQAFFVHATTVPALLPVNYEVYFNENNKVSGSGITTFNRPQGTPGTKSQRQFFRTSLYTGASSTAVIADGNVVAFDPVFTNAIDGNDALKIAAGGENFDIKRNGKMLVVEARNELTQNDTIYYNMTNLAQRNYQLRFAPKNMESAGMQAFLLDMFLNQETPVSLFDSSSVNISVTSNVLSRAADRFSVVFRQMAILPVTISSLKATLKEGDILVEWKVENETNLSHYEIERSQDGKTFTKAGTVSAGKQAIAYNWLDKKVENGTHYYRIRSVDKDGNNTVSNVVKVLKGNLIAEIDVYPNPIVNGVINVQLKNQAGGIYLVRILNPLGQTIITRKINYWAGDVVSEAFKFADTASSGIYVVEVTSPSNEKVSIKVVK